MRKPGSILFISCYELGHQPLGIAWASAFMRRAGFTPQVLDLSVEPFDPEQVQAARVVGISVPMHTALRLGVRVAEQVRRLNPTCHICFFGLYASLNAEFLLRSLADSVIGGEYEEALVSLVESLEAHRPLDIEGVARAGRPQAPVLKRLSFPVPDRGGLSGLERYAQLEHDGTRSLAGSVEASRGCKHQCLHCPIPPVYGGRFFVIPKDVVLEDIRRLAAAGARHITFGDPDFLNGPGHSIAIIRAMHEAFPALTFDFTAKIEHILKHRELFPELAHCGCLFVISAVESLSDVVLRHLEKGHVRQEVFEALTIVRQAGIALRPAWVPFTPWTTLEDFREVLDFVEDYLEILAFVERERLVYHRDPVQYAIRLLVPPGSGLLGRSAIQPFLRDLDQARLYYRWEHPDPRMDALHERVSERVEEAARQEEDAVVTFARIKALAMQAHGVAARHVTVPQAEGARPPRLTEAWFCCAEPTRDQFEPLDCMSEGGVDHV